MKAIMLFAIPLSAALAGCVAPAPHLEENFGNAVRQAVAQQTLNPNASLNNDPVAGIDGESAKNAADLYEETFKSPPPVVNVINIGGSISGGK
jgi:hypothetical protein